MKYTIKVNNDVKRITNPLLHLDGNRYDTREEACEAIYAAMYDVIDGDYGCEMVDRDIRGSLYTCDKNGENAEPLNAADEPYTVDDAVTVELGGDDPTLRLVETTLPNWDGVAFAAVNSDGEEVGWYQFRDVQPQETYIDACRDYIMREGYATEDGVSATVEEWTSKKTVRTADDIVDDWKRDNPDYEFVKIEFTADAVKIYYKGEIGMTGEVYDDVEEISAHLIAVAFDDDEGEIDVAAQTVTTWEL